jgi:predicted transcriptional regulator
MDQEGTTRKVDPGIVAEIVRSYLTKNHVAVDQLASLITTVHRALRGAGDAPLPAEVLTPAVPIRRSVQRDYVICLECGFQGLTLRRHLRVRHELDVAAYRARWKLAPDYPVTAPGYSEHRSVIAKQLGLGRRGRRGRRPVVSTPSAPPNRTASLTPNPIGRIAPWCARSA